MSKDDFDRIVSFIAVRAPHLYYLLKGVRVEISDSIDSIAETDGRTIYLCKNWPELEYKLKLYSILHELYHIILLHVVRNSIAVREAINRYGILDVDKLYDLYNLVADRIVAQAVKEEFGITDEYTIRAFENLVGRVNIEGMSAEEIFFAILDRVAENEIVLSKIPVGKFGKDILKSGERDAGNGKDNGKILLNDGRETIESIESLVLDAYTFAESCGAGNKLTSVEKKVFNGLRYGEVDWRSVLRQSLVSHLWKSYVSTWKKVHRKGVELAGYNKISNPRVWALVDVSGSVWDTELKKFMEELIGIIGSGCELIVITWDKEITGIHKVRNRNDIEKLEVCGGGGTVLSGVIEKLSEMAKPADYVILFTDAYIYDADKAKELIKNLYVKKKVLVRSNSNKSIDDVFDEVHVLGGGKSVWRR